MYINKSGTYGRSLSLEREVMLPETEVPQTHLLSCSASAPVVSKVARAPGQGRV